MECAKRTSLMTHRERVVVGMSGGVDSSVAAWLLKQQGYEVVGVFMKNWEDDDTDEYCTSREDLIDAAAVADVIGIELDAVNFAAEYRERVFAHFLRDYAAGRTPNPDVLCNREIKFRHFLDAARALGAAGIATGHYARVARTGGAWRLLRARDRGKDQSYFLHLLGQEALAATRFPLGELEKGEVRAIAAEAGLPTAAKKDSTGICFIGERDFREFLARYLPAREGEIRDPQGRVLGTHPGVFYFTLGQRGGLQLGGVRGRDPAPWYVVGKDVRDNILYVDQGHDSPWLHATRAWTGAVHWVAGSPPARRFACTAQARYRQQEEDCEVELEDDGTLQVRFLRAQRAVTPGQSLVLYDGDGCLGGAVIATTDAPRELRQRGQAA